MYALLVLALLGASPSDSPPKRWIPLPSNPALEIYGREDASGQFRYTEMRPVRPPITNYGVSLPEPSPTGHMLQASAGANAVSAELARDSLRFDGPVGMALQGAIEASNPEAAEIGAKAESGIDPDHGCTSAADCPNGDKPCPWRKKPKVEDLDELSGFVALVKSKQEVAFAIAALLLTLLFLGVFCVALIWGCRVAFRYLFKE